MNGLLNPDEAATYLGMSRRWVYDMTRHGKLPHVKMPGGNLRYKRTDLDTWIDAHYREASGIQPLRTA